MSDDNDTQTGSTDAAVEEVAVSGYEAQIAGRVNYATPTSGGLRDVGVTPPAPERTTSATSEAHDPVAAAPSDTSAGPVSGATQELDAVGSDMPLVATHLVSDRTPPEKPRAHRAPSPLETITEIQQLSVAYARQETVGPLSNLGKWVGFGVGGAVFMGLGGFLLALALLRGLQHVSALDGSWSFVPYLAVTLALGIAIAFTARAMQNPVTRNAKDD